MAAPRSTRRRFDDEGWQPTLDLDDEPHTSASVAALSTYVDAAHGPSPVPSWVVTDPRAVDIDRGVLKTGKEAEVSLVERRLTSEAGTASCLLAAKRYRAAEHRNFHRDSGYLEGRKVKESREMRAIENRTAYGREIIAQQWALAEFTVLGDLWSAGAAVPYPVQLLGTEILMEFVGSDDGVAAPRLAETRPSRTEVVDLHAQLVALLRALAEHGFAHGDLSAYNLLVADGRLVAIDLPQAVDIVANPQGFEFLRRDCENITRWFAAHGMPEADADALVDDLVRWWRAAR